MISAFLLCWMPYTVLSFLAMSGHGDMITPGTAIVPCFLVKTGAATNAIIYILTSKKVSNIYFYFYISSCIKLCNYYHCIQPIEISEITLQSLLSIVQIC